MIPVGLAFELAEKTGRAKLRMPDGRHPSAAGTYLYGAVLYSSLFGRSPEGLAYRGGCEKPLEPALARFLQGCAWKAVTASAPGRTGRRSAEGWGSEAGTAASFPLPASKRPGAHRRGFAPPSGPSRRDPFYAGGRSRKGASRTSVMQDPKRPA
ncbi:hypothetical protein MAF45_05445 [Mesosutterella sp. OilRF-GAM-744-9]|uniref:Uncharacterized protein n=1 Tax=Mesosutterella porci TaxID=2915351 RepID=A0ABS9MQI7_9BURK|nr:hypothetical protein [Mesosutterella sp. oilRF-744-WT-GAM-9]MCG5030888.1 hypothetical protein [Mesosutterella sp. oilRF-744-WT-GAM-9]